MKTNTKKPFKLLDRLRSMKKGLMVTSLSDLIHKGKTKFDYPSDQEVIVVLDEDGTEVEDDDYLNSLPDQSTLVLLYAGDRWDGSTICEGDEVDASADNPLTRVSNLLLKLESSPGSIALLPELDLELLADMDTEQSRFQRFDAKFLQEIKQAADIHIMEKGKIRDTLDLLKIYHKSKQQCSANNEISPEEQPLAQDISNQCDSKPGTRNNKRRKKDI